MFLYFDLGNVLLHFDHCRQCEQMAAAARSAGRNVSTDDVWRLLFEGDLNARYEAGQVSTDEFYEEFCQTLDVRPDRAEFDQACGDIFWVSVSIKPVLAGLIAARRPLGILSNTNELHWRWIASGRFGPVPEAFPVRALSYEIGALKPGAEIYRRAAELARERFPALQPQEIFFVDDRAENIAAARDAGFDAVAYTSPRALAEELRRRGVGLNY